MRVIAIANQKGGCGKTTTAINLSSGLAYLGQKTLLVDLDPQGHSTVGLGYDVSRYEKSLYDVLSPFEKPAALEEVILQLSANHHLVPSHVILSAIEQQLSGVFGREEKLLEKLNSVESQYDFAIIDCPPNLGLLTFNALRAARELVIPLDPSYFSLQGVKKIRETVELIRETLKHHIDLRVLLTQYSSQSNFNRKILEQLTLEFKDRLFKTVIKKNVRLQEAQEQGESIFEFDQKSTGFNNYLELSKEVLEGKEISSSTEGVEQPVHEAHEKGHPEENSFILKVNDGINLPRNSYSDKQCPAQLKEGVLFGYQDTRAKLVQIAGDFNNWVNESMDSDPSRPGHWEKLIALPPGKHRYKFIVDGEWTVDPQNEVLESNPYGGTDSVIQVAHLNEEELDERSSKV